MNGEVEQVQKHLDKNCPDVLDSSGYTALVIFISYWRAWVHHV